MKDWTSLHIFYHNVPKYDDFIIKLCEKLDEFRQCGRLEKWFFIRYWEGGPHIRVRMLHATNECIEEIKHMAFGYMKHNPSAKSVTREEYYKDNKFDGKPIDSEMLPWYQDGEIVEIPYEQEIQRYGGKEVMEMSETIFCLSSYLVKNILESTRNSFNQKLIFAEALTLIEVEEYRKVYGRNNITEFIKIYSENWKSFLYNTDNEKQIDYFFKVNSRALNSAIEILRNNKDFMHLIELIQDEIWHISEKGINQDYMDYIIASQIHMTNNRLGAAPIFEYFISKNLIMRGKEGIKDARS